MEVYFSDDNREGDGDDDDEFIFFYSLAPIIISRFTN